MDVSSLSMILRKGIVFKDLDGNPVNIFNFLKKQGINTVRLRTWVGNDINYNRDSILKISKMARSQGLLMWLDLHYSNNWADPGNQEIPIEWNHNNLDSLKIQLSMYTSEMVKDFNPDYIQLGNEIDGGFLWPLGSISDTSSFYSLCRTAVSSVKSASSNTRIIYHIANYKKADWFFNQLQAHNVNYDIGGVSYYPKWHGNNIDSLFETLNRVYTNTGKRMIIAENSYPWTMQWADWTDNVMGWDQDLHPDYPATPEGQASFVETLVRRCKSMPFASGYAYWEGVWVAFDGPESKTGSPWENQACFDFDFKALPVWRALGDGD